MLSPTNAILCVLSNGHMPPKDFKKFTLHTLGNTRPGNREMKARKQCPVSGEHCEEYRDCHKKNYCWLK